MGASNSILPYNAVIRMSSSMHQLCTFSYSIPRATEVNAFDILAILMREYVDIGSAFSTSEYTLTKEKDKRKKRN